MSMKSPREVMPPKKSSGSGNTGIIVGAIIGVAVLMSIAGLCGCAGLVGYFGAASSTVEVESYETLEAPREVESSEGFGVSGGLEIEASDAAGSSD